MKRSIITIVGIALAALVLASCASAPQRQGAGLIGKPMASPKVSVSQAAINKLESYTQYDPSTQISLYNYVLSHQAWWVESVVPGLNPQLPDLAQLAKTIPGQTVWRQIAGVYTGGVSPLYVVVNICEQGTPSGPPWPRITNFTPGPTTGPAIAKGTPVVKQEVVNGKKVIVSIPSPGGQHQPGPFFPFTYQYNFSHGRWSLDTYNAGRFSCENHM